MASPIVQGWCPGAHKPMMSGDGLVVRVRPYAAEISAAQAAALATAATEFGNGFFDVTNRANLQVRGVSDDNYPLLMAALSDANLLDSDEDIEVKRNIVVTPFWEDGDASHSLYRALVDALARFPKFPGKFGFVIDCGPTRVLDGVPGDIRFERTVDGRLLIRADGSETGRAITADGAVDAALELVDWFMNRRNPDTRRFAKLLNSHDFDSTFTGLEPAKAVGAENQNLLYVPFGQMAASDLAQLSNSNTPLRITPWRAILSTSPVALKQTNFVLDPNAPILGVSACAGKPYCPQATVETRTLATSLARKWRGHVHVSGCSKGCAKPSASDITLVGRDGRFDLVRNGASWDDALYTNLSPTDLETLDLT